MKLSQLNAASFEQFKPYLDTVLVPVGSMESHGPHVPFGTDLFITDKIVEELEEQFSGRVLTLPAISYGHCFALCAHAGTINIPHDVLRDYVYHTLRPFQQWGFKYIVLVNGNGGNISGLEQAVEMLVDDGMTCLLSNWWQDCRDAIREIAPGTGHGGEDETSLMLAIQPDLVDMKQTGTQQPPDAQGLYSPQLAASLYPQGYAGDPAVASSEKGERILKLVKERLASQITSLWS